MDFVARLQPGQLPSRTARQLPRHTDNSLCGSFPTDDLPHRGTPSNRQQQRKGQPSAASLKCQDTPSRSAASPATPTAVSTASPPGLPYPRLDRALRASRSGPCTALRSAQRLSPGFARLFRQIGQWDYDEDTAYRFGSPGSGNIRAEGDTNMGNRLAGWNWKPRFVLRSDAASGDKKCKEPES
ncbi:MAG: alginate export family protein [Bryobacteraceae bacterium]